MPNSLFNLSYHIQINIHVLHITYANPQNANTTHPVDGRLTPTWQYFGAITCDRLHGIMKLYIDKL